MANRFEREFPDTTWHPGLPPLGPEDAQRYLARGRQLRAEAMQAGGRAFGSAVARAVRRAAALVRCAAAGQALRAPVGRDGRPRPC